jgi:hypothetical protein
METPPDRGPARAGGVASLADAPLPWSSLPHLQTRKRAAGITPEHLDRVTGAVNLILMDAPGESMGVPGRGTSAPHSTPQASVR